VAVGEKGDTAVVQNGSPPDTRPVSSPPAQVTPVIWCEPRTQPDMASPFQDGRAKAVVAKAIATNAN